MKSGNAAHEIVGQRYELVEHQPGGPEHDGQVGHQEQAPQNGVDQPHPLVVPPAQVLGDGVDARAPVIGREDEGGEDQRRQAADPVEVRHHDPVLVALARHRDEIERPDVRDHQAHTDRPPRQHPPGKEVVARGLDVPREVRAHEHDPEHVQDDHEYVIAA
jgi:hypothetical protein